MTITSEVVEQPRVIMVCAYVCVCVCVRACARVYGVCVVCSLAVAYGMYYFYLMN